MTTYITLCNPFVTAKNYNLLWVISYVTVYHVKASLNLLLFTQCPKQLGELLVKLWKTLFDLGFINANWVFVAGCIYRGTFLPQKLINWLLIIFKIEFEVNLTREKTSTHAFSLSLFVIHVFIYFTLLI